MKLIVGLGNPGPAYTDSRHNLGFKCVNLFARNHGMAFDKQKSKAKISMGQVSGQKLILAKPRTYMNLSGTSVVPLMHYYKIDPADLLVIYDDIDLPLGRMRIRPKGSAGGHNGMKSIIQNLGTQEFSRIRLGIGAAQNGDQSIASHATRSPGYVLGRFSAEEKPVIEKVIDRVQDAIDCILTEGITAAMNQFNTEV